MSLTKAFLFLFIALASLSPDMSLACGGHGCGPCGGGGAGFVGGGFVGGPLPLIGGGAVAFRRANRLQRRSFRAASFGLFGRSARLQARAGAAFNRGLFRNGAF